MLPLIHNSLSRQSTSYFTPTLIPVLQPSLCPQSSVGVGYNLTLVMQQPNDAQNPPSPHPHTPATNGTSPSSAAGPASPPTSAADTACSHVSGTDASSAAAAAALALARRHVPCAELLSAAGAEVVLRLPREAAGAFPPLLRALAGAEGRAAGVASFGLSVTTLEVRADCASAISVTLTLCRRPRKRTRGVPCLCNTPVSNCCRLVWGRN